MKVQKSNRPDLDNLADSFKIITEAWSENNNKEFYLWNNYCQVVKCRITNISVVSGDYEGVMYFSYGKGFTKASIYDPEIKAKKPSEFIGKFGAFWEVDKKTWVPGKLVAVRDGYFWRNYNGWYSFFMPADNLDLDSDNWPDYKFFTRMDILEGEK